MATVRSLVALGLAICSMAPAAWGQTHGYKFVPADNNIYGAGQNSAPGGGKVPRTVIPVTSGEQCLTIRKVRGSITAGCASAEGCVTLNGGNNFNNPDGTGGQVVKTSNTGTSLISGIEAPGEGYLVGVFLPTGGPSGPPPAALDFYKGQGTGLAFHTLSPQLDQTFFIGDGRRGNGIGARQSFVVPTGANSIVLGFSDTCDNGHGSPGCYSDNLGRFTVRYDLSTTACQ